MKTQALDIEDEVRVGRDIRAHGAVTVAQFRGDGDAALATDRQAEDTDVHALDDLTGADLEGERLALLIGY